MKPLLPIVALVLLVPTGAAQGGLPKIESVFAAPQNQAVVLAWDAIVSPQVVGYAVYAYRDGVLLATTNVTEPSYRFLGTNDVTYVFQVAARDANGDLGPKSDPVGATPHFDRDLQYLAAGLVVTWLGLFGYAALLSRKEDRLARKLEQLLQHEIGRNPP